MNSYQIILDEKYEDWKCVEGVYVRHCDEECCSPYKFGKRKSDLRAWKNRLLTGFIVLGFMSMIFLLINIIDGRMKIKDYVEELQHYVSDEDIPLNILEQNYLADMSSSFNEKQDSGTLNLYQDWSDWPGAQHNENIDTEIIAGTPKDVPIVPLD